MTMTVWPSAFLCLTMISIHTAYLLCRSTPLKLMWEAVEWFFMICSAAHISIASVIRRHPVILFNAAAFSASLYSVLLTAHFVTSLSSSPSLETVRDVAHTYITPQSELGWAVGRCLAGLATGLCTLSKAEEEAERERFNRRFASKFFCADSAFIL